ncbi:short chain dehydrogenase/reductase family protein-like protein [Mytilinidion resinicola]|uniref:Short chain dehydrogenase/reductase family protein-like protein n=1 Tax=Mytilinidion resinicola TaxID=574789 RepID=A0A6A6YPQ5_9PEZI|nr:short chain dehydrogenase/reductase family protein-like protein [Mytilinidion resinicola]KAF2810731.1 short chain dehydrogenase/reductase family protein-like protein [Mytilinidion resinicola]
MTPPQSATSSSKPQRPRSPKFPPHNAPRVWFITTGTSPIAIALARQVLEHGDYVVAGVLPIEFEKHEGRSEEFRAFLEDVKRTERWRERLRVVGLDGRSVGQCQAAIAEAIEAFGRVDVLLGCTSEAVVGTVEELAQSSRTISLVQEQFETNFFANVNVIKAVLPNMRQVRNGHVIMLTGITAHLGTPGLGMYCSSQWAIEGYCDSLAYEIAPFNIKMSIVQPNMEVNVLTNRITSVPPLPQYSPDVNPAPLAREILSGILDKIDLSNHPYPEMSPGQEKSPSSTDMDVHMPYTGDLLSSPQITSLYPPLSQAFKSALVAETVHALTAIGGHDNPPARHIVGSEGVTSVKEKLKTVSEELEDFIEVSGAVDIRKGEDAAF